MSQQAGRRCRTCKGLVPPLTPTFPTPEALIELQHGTKIVFQAAAEFDEISQGELTLAVEFARFLDFEVQRAAAYGASSPTRADAS